MDYSTQRFYWAQRANGQRVPVMAPEEMDPLTACARAGLEYIRDLRPEEVEELHRSRELAEGQAKRMRETRALAKWWTRTSTVTKVIEVLKVLRQGAPVNARSTRIFFELADKASEWEGNGILNGYPRPPALAKFEAIRAEACDKFNP